MEEETSPRKVLIKTLPGSSLSTVWISGQIEQTVGTSILIVSDSSGKAKISGCDSAYQESDTSWIRKGSHCSIIGKLVNNKALPEIQAKKIINLSSNISISIWESEIKCLDHFLNGKIEPNVS